MTFGGRCLNCGYEPEQKKEKKMSFKVEILAVGETKFVANALRFGTDQEGKDYGNDLLSRWFGAKEFRVVPSDDPVNYIFSAGKLVEFTQQM
jgi:hypothetical protein